MFLIAFAKLGVGCAKVCRRIIKTIEVTELYYLLANQKQEATEWRNYGNLKTKKHIGVP